MAVTDLLTKKPFYRLQNSGLMQKSEVPVDNMRYTEKQMVGMPLTQTDFLEEYYPSAHKITSEVFFPECYNYGEIITETGEKMETMYREETFRVAVPLQAVITVQHLVHMFGNDTHHELTDTKVNDELNTKFYDYQNGWLVKNMDIALYQLGRSADITGDGALVFYYYQGQIHTKNLSFLDGDLIFPHYDSITGEMDVFARKFSSYDEQGNEYYPYFTKVILKVGEDKKLRIGVKRNNDAGTPAGNWTIVDDFKLLYFGTNSAQDPSADASGIATATAENMTKAAQIFTVSGTRVSSLQKGINIVRTSNGEVKKIYVK
jgi:hypothetical protein